MLVVWIFLLIIGLFVLIKAEKIADIWRSTEFSSNTSDGKRQRQLMRRMGFWKLIGVIIVAISIFLIAGGDDLFIDKSTDAILNSTPKEKEVIK